MVARTDIVVTDERTPHTEVDATVRWPLGALVAFGPQRSRRNAVVIGHGEGTIDVLDGVEHVTLRQTQLRTATLLARSADDFAERFIQKVQTLRSERGWCTTPEDHIRVVSDTALIDDQPIRVVVTTVGHYEVLPGNGRAVLNGNLAEVLRRSYVANHGYFQRFESGPNSVAVVQTGIELVDEFPTA